MGGTQEDTDQHAELSVSALLGPLMKADLCNGQDEQDTARWVTTLNVSFVKGKE